MQTLAPKEAAVQLLNQLNQSELAAIVQLLEVMVSERSNTDTLTASERTAIAEADEWLEHHAAIPHEQVLADFGLTMEDWEKMADEPLELGSLRNA